MTQIEAEATPGTRAHGTRTHGNASQTLPAGRTTTVVECMALCAGIVIIGVSYLTGVTTRAGIVVVIGIVLILSAVLAVVASWLAGRADKQARLILMVLDRHERDRSAEYGTTMRQLQHVARTDHDIRMSMSNDMTAVMREQLKIGQSLVMLAGGLTASADLHERGICKSSRDHDEIRERIDGLSEALSSEILAINGAMGGLRSTVDDAVKTGADQRSEDWASFADWLHKETAGLVDIRKRPPSDDPIADLIRYKRESGDLYSPPESIGSGLDLDSVRD